MAEPFVCIKVAVHDRRPLRMEAAILRQLRNPHFPNLILDGSPDGYLIEELILGERMSDRPSASLLHDLPRIAADLALILKSLSTLRPAAMHRDIKPNNLFLTGNGLVLLDFGSAEWEGKRTGWQVDPGHPKLGTGKYPYQPIEQLTGDPAQDRRVDVFAGAAVIFEILTGQPPYPNQKPDLQQALDRVAEREAALNTLLSPFSADVRTALLEGLRVDFRRRARFFDAIAAAIEDSLDFYGAAGNHHTPVSTTLETCGRRGPNGYQ